VAERFLHRVVERLAVRYGLEAVRGYVLKRLEGVTPDDLYLAIKGGRRLWPVIPDPDKRRGRLWSRRFGAYMDRLTTKTVLVWLSQDRPDLASVILNLPPKMGMRWLDQQVADLRRRFSRSR